MMTTALTSSTWDKLKVKAAKTRKQKEDQEQTDGTGESNASAPMIKLNLQEYALERIQTNRRSA